jgi:Uma2 family endonuclease
MTAEAFDEYALLPENRELLLELIAGEIREVVSNNISSKIAGKILGAFDRYEDEHDIIDITGADGGYKIGNERYIPDVGVTLKAKQPELNLVAYSSIPPDLAVEVVSPGNSEHEIRLKVVNYLAAGCIVWVVYPETQRVEVYVPNQPVQFFGIEDTLDGGTLLPDFVLPVKKIFKR